MTVSCQPGCCGTAARLPNKPGRQKLTPFSSANDTVGRDSAAPSAITRLAAKPRSEQLMRGLPIPVARSIVAPPERAAPRPLSCNLPKAESRADSVATSPAYPFTHIDKSSALLFFRPCARSATEVVLCRAKLAKIFDKFKSRQPCRVADISPHHRVVVNELDTLFRRSRALVCDEEVHSGPPFLTMSSQG
jgi:hypothetical protein